MSRLLKAICWVVNIPDQFLWLNPVTLGVIHDSADFNVFSSLSRSTFSCPFPLTSHLTNKIRELYSLRELYSPLLPNLTGNDSDSGVWNAAHWQVGSPAGTGSHLLSPILKPNVPYSPRSLGHSSKLKFKGLPSYTQDSPGNESLYVARFCCKTPPAVKLPSLSPEYVPALPWTCM